MNNSIGTFKKKQKQVRYFRLRENILPSNFFHKQPIFCLDERSYVRCFDILLSFTIMMYNILLEQYSRKWSIFSASE